MNYLFVALSVYELFVFLVPCVHELFVLAVSVYELFFFSPFVYDCLALLVRRLSSVRVAIISEPCEQIPFKFQS